MEFTGAEEDAKRRDFTVNGLFFDPLKDEVLDYVGGRADLEKKILRAIGDPAARFREDHLRLLRAVRFATMLDFAIEEQTFQAVRDLSAGIRTVSAERIRDELSRIFLHPEPRARLRPAHGQRPDGGGPSRDCSQLKGCEQPPQFHPEGDVFTHTRIMLGLLPRDVSLPLVLSVLFHDIAKPATFAVDETGRIRFNGHDKLGAAMTEEILRRLKFPNAVIAPTVDAVENHMVFKDVQQMRVSRLKRFIARPTIEDEMELHRVDCTSSHAMLDNYDFLRAKQAEFAAQREPLIPPPLLNGHDLIGLGLPPGPRIRELLGGVQNLQLEGALNTRDEALEWVQEMQVASGRLHMDEDFMKSSLCVRASARLIAS